MYILKYISVTSTIYGNVVDGYLYIRYDDVRFNTLNAKILAECNSIESIEYYLDKRTKGIIGMNHRIDTPFETMYPTIDEIVDYLIAYEYFNNERKTSQNRMKNGRFGKGNQIAYRDAVSPVLVVALQKLGLTVTEIAKALNISRTTVYARLETYYKTK